MKGSTRGVPLNREEAEGLIDLVIKAMNFNPFMGEADAFSGCAGAVKLAEAFGMGGAWLQLLKDAGDEPDRAAPYVTMTTCGHCGCVAVEGPDSDDKCPSCKGELPSIATRVKLGGFYRPGQESGG